MQKGTKHVMVEK